MTDGQRNGFSTESRDTQLSRPLKQLLQGLDNRYGQTDVVQQLGDIGNHLSNMHHTIDGIARRQEHSEQIQREMAAAIRSLDGKTELLEQASQHNTRLTDDHYRSHIIMPLTRRLTDFLDLVETSLDSIEPEQRYRLVCGVYDLLSIYGVEPVSANRRDELDPRWMKTIAHVDTENPELDCRVHSVVRRGFRYRDQVIQPITVKLYRHVS